MKTKLLSLFTLVTMTLSAQQVYYTVPGANGNSGNISDMTTIGNTIYLAVNSYSPDGAFPVSQRVLAIDTSQPTVAVQQVSIASGNQAIVTISETTNTLRVGGSSSTGTSFFDIDLTQSLPTAMNQVSSIPVNGLNYHDFYQNDFIYSTFNTGYDLILPLQTLNGNFYYDLEVFGDELFYVSGNNDLLSIDLTSATASPQPLFSDTDGVTYIEVTTNFIYYGTAQNSSIKRFNRSDNTVTTLATLPQTNSNPFFNQVRTVEIIGNEIYYAPVRGDLYVITDNLLSSPDFNISNLKVHPNPASSIVNIETNLQVTSVEILSVLGKKLDTVKNSKEIDISALSSGIYFLKIQTETGKSETLRFIKK